MIEAWDRGTVGPLSYLAQLPIGPLHDQLFELTRYCYVQAYIFIKAKSCAQYVRIFFSVEVRNYIGNIQESQFRFHF